MLFNIPILYERYLHYEENAFLSDVFVLLNHFSPSCPSSSPPADFFPLIRSTFSSTFIYIYRTCTCTRYSAHFYKFLHRRRLQFRNKIQLIDLLSKIKGPVPPSSPLRATIYARSLCCSCRGAKTSRAHFIHKNQIIMVNV